MDFFEEKKKWQIVQNHKSEKRRGLVEKNESPYSREKKKQQKNADLINLITHTHTDKEQKKTKR